MQLLTVEETFIPFGSRNAHSFMQKQRNTRHNNDSLGPTFAAAILGCAGCFRGANNERNAYVQPEGSGRDIILLGSDRTRRTSGSAMSRSFPLAIGAEIDFVANVTEN